MGMTAGQGAPLDVPSAALGGGWRLKSPPVSIHHLSAAHPICNALILAATTKSSNYEPAKASKPKGLYGQNRNNCKYCNDANLIG
jgi:hypothetical protein